MKKLLLYLGMAGMINVSLAQQYVPVNEGSSVSFKIKNFGFGVSGSFTGLEGKITFDPNNPLSCNFDVSIDANTVNTGINMRDNHLRDEDYFDVKKFPRIHFLSTRIIPPNKNGYYYLYGKLTIKNQTRDISFPFTAVASAENYRFKVEFKINRRDFGVGGSSTISDNLELLLDVLAKNVKK